MSKTRSTPKLSRRGLLKGAGLAGAAAVGAPLAAKAQTAGQPDGPPRPVGAGAGAQSAHGAGHPGRDADPAGLGRLRLHGRRDPEPRHQQIAANPGTSFRGLHESLINYSNLEWHTCTHEETSVAMAHGYAKIEGKPMLVLATAWSACSTPRWRSTTPGATACRSTSWSATRSKPPSAARRRPMGALGAGSAALVRDFIKWDDTPVSLQHFADSAVRAYKIAMTPPMAPVLLILDAELQEEPMPEHKKAPAHPEAVAHGAGLRRFRTRWRKPRRCWSRRRIR